MRSARHQRVLLGILACVVLLIAALWTWSPIEGPSNPAVIAEPHGTRVDGGGVTSASKTPLEIVETPVSSPPVVARSEIAPPAGHASRAESKPKPTAPEDGVTLDAQFTRPDGSVLEVERASIELRDAAGSVRSAAVRRSQLVRIERLVPDIYTVQVVAPGFDHREQILDMRLGEQAPRDRVFQERLTLWPADWVAVVVETPDGRSFAALAADLGQEPMRLFVGAFQVHARLDAPGSGVASGANQESGDGESKLARFRPPPKYKSWELPKSCIGSLEVLHRPPLWLGLDLFGKPVGWEMLAPGQHEVVFRIDLALLEARFARVALRVVDGRSHAPLAGASVTLRADASAHRRSDQSNVPTGRDGRVEFARIVPGRYELAVARGEAQHQRMLALDVGERRDLGEIALGDSLGVDVLVIDELDKPTKAYLEIGPFTKGARSGEMYPQMIRHSADASGKGRVPMPSDPAIIRATLEGGRWNGDGSVQEIRGVRSANVMLDPRTPPSAPLRLKLRTPVEVHLTTKLPEAQRIEVWDEFDVVVARTVKGKGTALDAQLVPGRYRARTVAADGTAGFETPFTVDREPQRIELD